MTLASFVHTIRKKHALNKETPKRILAEKLEDELKSRGMVCLSEAMIYGEATLYKNGKNNEFIGCIPKGPVSDPKKEMWLAKLLYAIYLQTEEEEHTPYKEEKFLSLLLHPCQ